MLKLQLVLPCYNEAGSVEFLIKRAADAAMRAGFDENSFQLLMVENGSKDNSKQILQDLKASALGKWFNVVVVEKNQGYGYGLNQGLRSSTAPVIAWSHADQQCDPADVFSAYKVLMQESQDGRGVLVKGVRSGRNWKDIFVSRVFELCARIFLGLNVSEINAQPKIFHRDLLNSATQPPNDFAFDMYMLYHAQKNSYTFKTIPVRFPPRIHGFSNWSANFFSRYKTILKMINYMRALSKQEGRI